MMNYLKLLGFILLGSCAIMSSPEGGAKDETPPAIVRASPPNKSINFTAKTIEIEFDEYVQLSNFGTEFYSSPPLKNRISQKLKGKKLTLTLDEELLPNTTYTFNFGNSISDITEKNVQAGYKYVFSTGSYLDSLAIFGNVVDAYSGLPEEGLIALLYPHDISDSALINQKPLYYAITNEDGNFLIDNLALDTFQLLAVKDDNLDLIYNKGAEKYGFVSYPIISEHEEPQSIRVFNERGGLKLMESTQKDYGKLLFGFNKPPFAPQITIVGSDVFPENKETIFVESDQNGDTLYYWYNPNIYPEDSRFFFVNVRADSLKADSVRVLLNKIAQPKLGLKVVDGVKISPAGKIILESSLPVNNIDTSLFTVYRGEEKVPFTFAEIDKRHFTIDFERGYGDGQKLQVLPGGFTDFFGGLNDSINLGLNVAKEEDLAVLLMKVSSIDGKDKLFQLFDVKSKKVREERAFTYKLEFTLKDLTPGSFAIRIIWDDNNNGRWDGGTFIGRKQPEEVMYYPKPIEIRANWELETVWEIPSK